MDSSLIWILTCALSLTMHDVSCSGIAEPPIVIHKSLYRRTNTLGEYNFDGVLIVSGALSTADWELAVMHEQSHYLSHATKALPVPYTFEQVCLHEERAWEISNYYAQAKGYVYDLRWWENYAHYKCKEHN